MLVNNMILNLHSMRKLMIFFILFKIHFIYAHENNQDNIDFKNALNLVYTLQSTSRSPGELTLCRKKTVDLMIRQGIPIEINLLRELNDTELFRLAVLAALSGLGQFARDSNTGAIQVDDETGNVVRALIPADIESDVMLCIICALLTVIAVFHVVLPPSQSLNSNTNTNNNNNNTIGSGNGSNSSISSYASLPSSSNTTKTS